MKIVAISDLHDRINPKIPECDLLLVAGDLNNLKSMEKWLNSIDLPSERIVGIAGNHDFDAQSDPDSYRHLPWTYLQDETYEFEDLVIHGTPWTPTFFDWAFMTDEKELEYFFDKIRPTTNILISHGPPYGYNDMNSRGLACGSKALRDRVAELPDLKLHVYGHIHEGRTPGQYMVYPNGAISANVSVLDGQYRKIDAPLEVFKL